MNARLNELYKNEQNKYMAYKLENARPRVNIRCPESYLFYKNQFHKKGAKDNLGI